MTKLAICGAAGRMGRRMLALAENDADLEVTGVLEISDHAALGERASGDVVFTSDGRAALADCDVAITFSLPEGTMDHVALAVELGKPLVIGTTGLTRKQQATISEAAGKVPVVFAPNMSLGVNLLFDLVAKTAKVLGDDYDIEIVEAHHHLKKDSPSGTAVKLGEIAAEALDRDYEKDAVHGRIGMVGERTKKEIGMHAVRGGDVVGEHTVIFAGVGERIELTHRAHSRDAFASGALTAAKFVHGRDVGLYDMQHVTGLKSFSE
ncbi:4-hydroxy-tetrahydrodipicolinate reductase [Candidatus Hydrogenedentota bacterium]